MTTAMAYSYLKALHVAAAILFVAGVFATTVFLAAVSPRPDLAARQRTAEVARRWERVITTPAMLLVWGLGLWMALSAGWFAAPWLRLKLVFVVVLSALHGLQSGRLRRLAAGRSTSNAATPPWWFAGPVVVVAVLAIATLVVVKPF